MGNSRSLRWCSFVMLLVAGAGALQAQVESPFEQRAISSEQPLRARVRMRFDGERFLAGPGDYEFLGQRGRDTRRSRRAPGSGASAGSREPDLPQRLEARVLCIDAVNSNGFFAAGTTGAEWMDWAGKVCNSTELITRFAFGYATTARDVSESGPGAALGLSFYEGTSGFCSRGTIARTVSGTQARFSFLGLPAAVHTQVSPGFLFTATLPDNDPLVLA